MAILRRSKFLVFILAVMLAAGSALPSSALWQCRHAARVVSASFLAAPAVMPCRMADAPMPRMACCPAPAAVTQNTSSHRASLTTPPCHPAFIGLAALPCACVSEMQFSLRLTLAFALTPVLPLFAAALPPVPDPLSLCRRPPPVSSAQSVPLRTPGLRAPPAE